MPATNKNKAQVILLSGFLGSGKTSLINQMLESSKDLSKIVIIVNEFGKLGIDKSLIKHQEDNVIQMTSGCICCTMAVDLKNGLIDIHKKHDPRFVFIEPSGIADPFSIQNIFDDPDIGSYFKLINIVTILDAKCWRIRSVFGELFEKQLHMADLILLNKIDLIEQDDIRKTLLQLKQKYPDTRIVPTVQCRIDPGMLFEALDRDNAETKVKSTNNFFSQHYPCSEGDDISTKDDSLKFSSFVFSATKPINESTFYQFLDQLPIEIFRIKGPIVFRDDVRLLNFTGGQKVLEAWNGKPETNLVIIGWEMDIDSLKKSLNDCLLEKQKREIGRDRGQVNNVDSIQ